MTRSAISKVEEAKSVLSPRQQFVLQILRINAWAAVLVVFMWGVGEYVEKQEERHHEFRMEVCSQEEK